MKDKGSPHARRVPVATEEHLLGPGAYDYADAFQIEIDERDPRSAEQLARDTLEQAPRLVRSVIRIAHRYVLRFRLGPPASPDHVLGWEILRSEPQLAHVEATSSLLRAAIVGRRTGASSTVTTYLFFRRPAARVLFKVVGPVHRRITPYLLERAAATARRTAPSATRSTGHRRIAPDVLSHGVRRINRSR
ncbi:MAG: DUF2867 domain-containing protein [Actinomycetota bacterium]|nr:DUF2867 domain-containing protein [Actinomycetota bacterium]